MPPLIENARIRMNSRLGSQYFLLSLESPRIAGAITPGQFVMVEVQRGHDPLLRRPFSAHRVIASEDESRHVMELLVKIVGRGTRLLGETRRGDEISLIGPLGRGFSLDGPSRRILVVGGGCGVAPLPFVTERLILAGHRVEVFYGAERASHLVCRETLSSLGVPLHISTDDGSAGHCGPVTDLVSLALELPRGQEVSIMACGPLPMLRVIKEIAEAHRISCQVSLETAMACGFGVCLGCSVKGARQEPEYPLACLDGPVFDAERVEV